MAEYKRILCVLLCALLSGLAMAQNNTNSPYTRFGYGQLSDYTSTKSKAMGGTTYGMRDKYLINAANPASYSAVDSLTLLFDGGVTLQNANFSDGTTKLNAKNSSVDYIAMQLRLRRGLGLTIGLLPFSNVGYNIGTSYSDNPANPYTLSYYGEGGLHQMFAGLGIKVIKNLSVGANISYLWGNINRSTKVIFADQTMYHYIRSDYMSVRDVKFDLGAQYTYNFDRKNTLTLGAVFSPKRNLNNDAYVTVQKYRYDDGEVADVVTETIDEVAIFGIPNSFGAGFSYMYDNRLTIAGDVNLQKWSDVEYMSQKAFCDYKKVAIGIEYLPSLISRNYLANVKYRLGAYYATPYYQVEDPETKESYRAAKEYGITAGVGLPIPRTRSFVTVSAQYVNVTGQRATMLDEKYLKLSIGITFNERWFFKRKVD